ncbi:MAG: amylo-alpha-1,6-glucosidase [Chloroflexi bacterium]|nr:amylo-alpha-1,6-glucosidase [Chloroflexota bacterium]
MAVIVGPSTITINHNNRFLIAQPDASMAPSDDVGFFAQDTRFVSRYGVTINGRAPVLLNAARIEHFSVRHEFASPELPLGTGALGASGISLPPRSIGFRLDRTISEGIHEDYDLVSYAPEPVRLTLELEIGSDFADIFDVRWKQLLRRGDLQTAWRQSTSQLRTTYRNGDFVRELVVRVAKAGAPPQFANGNLVFAFTLEPKEKWHTCVHWLPVIGRRKARVLECSALLPKDARLDTKVLPPVEIEVDGSALPAIWRQAVADMESLRMEEFAVGRSVYVPAAGIPWYVTLFGRDSLVVAMESISGFPEFATGALDRLAAFQATDDVPEQDKEPGKVPHELRFGELAELGLLPFAPYYGTHDATPLFVVVLSYAYEWSSDKKLLRRFLPAAEAALRWILESGDRDGDGFQEYGTRSSRGLFNQGWKDSAVAIQHHDGTIPELPIALCEFQGYAYDAMLRMAAIREVLNDPAGAADLRSRARRLYDRFNDDFWWESEGTYALGLDGRKRQIRSVASNAGHCLASGIVPADRADRVVDRLMAPDMWSGWGIRTLSADHPGYNPFAYHLGSVWPHDNATIAGGFARYGRIAEAHRVARGIFAAAECFESYQLPELFAGLPREPGAFPVQYLGANVPQAWAAASVFRFVAILGGIHALGSKRRLYVHPQLPDWLPAVTIRNLRAGRGSADLRLERAQVEVLSNTTGFEIVHGPVPRAGPPGEDGSPG